MAGWFRRRTTRRAVLVVVLTVLMDPVGAVQAQNVPTDQRIERARDAQEHADEVVAEAQARLAALSAELGEARVRAAIAVEAYNGARAELSWAREAEEAAVAVAAEVHNERSAADVELGRLAAAVYRSGGGWSELSVMVNIATDASIVNVTEALTTVARSQSAVHARWSAALDEAESAVRDAERQVAERAAAERDAERALEQAKQAVAAHEQAVAQAAETQDVLIAELAAARGTTAELERERRRAEEQRESAERERAERRRAEQGRDDDGRAAGERAEPPQDAAERAEQDTERGAGQAAGQEQAAGGEQAESESRGDAEPEADAGPDPADATAAYDGGEPARTSFAGAAAAERAIDYARAQLGKPYVWAGAGPAGFDCSGLSMRAWEQGGVQLTHWSVAQARQTMAVSFSDLRPGDLVFWSANDAPSGTYHVALYIGGGEMIHAPSQGGHVEVQDVFYWRTPSFYSRVIA